jgi:hypothetical protein
MKKREFGGDEVTSRSIRPTINSEANRDRFARCGNGQMALERGRWREKHARKRSSRRTERITSPSGYRSLLAGFLADVFVIIIIIAIRGRWYSMYSCRGARISEKTKRKC